MPRLSPKPTALNDVDDSDRETLGEAPFYSGQSSSSGFVHELEISDNGDWVDNVYKSSKPSSFGGWLRRRRAWSPSSDRTIFTSADILCRGYLEKQGSWRKNWKTRYFILRSDTHSLCYFNNHIEMVLLGEVVISTNSDVWRGPKPNLSDSSSKRSQSFSPLGSSSNSSSISHSHRPSQASGSANLTFGVKCSTTNHTLIMDAPDAISLGVWLQAIQEEIQAARDNALNSSCKSIQKSSPATAHARTVEELLGTFAGNEVPCINCISYSDLPMATDANDEGGILNTAQALAASNSTNSGTRQSSKDGSGSAKKGKRGMLKRMFTSSKRNLEFATAESTVMLESSHSAPSLPEPPSSKAPLRGLVEEKSNSDNSEEDADVEAEADSQPAIPPREPLAPCETQQASDDEDEDILDATAERNISENFSPRQHEAGAGRDFKMHTPPRPNKGGRSVESEASPRDRYNQTANTNMGIQLSVQLSGVCEATDSLFIVVFGGKLSPKARVGLSAARNLYAREMQSSSKPPPSLANVDLSHVDWLQLGRTEVVRNKDAGSLISRTASKADPSSQNAGLPSGPSSALVCRQFSLMVNDPSRYGVDILMFAVYKANGYSDLLSAHSEVAWGVVDCDNLEPGLYSRLALNTIHNKSSSMAAFQDMNADLNLRLPSEMFQSPEPVAFLGICPTQSVGMTRRVYSVSQRLGFRTPPYCHKLYGFQSLQGQVLTREELYLPRYSLSVPAAMLALLLEERLPSVEKLLDVVVEELVHATKHLKATQKAVSEGVQANLDMFTGEKKRTRTFSSDKKQGGDNKVDDAPKTKRSGSNPGAMRRISSGGNLIDAVDNQISNASKGVVELEKAQNRVATLKRGEEVLKDVKVGLINEYMGCFNACMEAMRAEEEDREVIQIEVEDKSGKKKKKKNKKKEKALLMGIPRQMGGARLKRSVMKKSQTHAFMPTNMNIQLMHTERVGVTKIGDFATDSTDCIFKPDEEAWMERSAHKTKMQKTKDDPLKLAAFENDLSISRAAQVCALHARGLEMTVADLKSHAGGRRRNSILKLASRITNDGAEEDVKEIAARAVDEDVGEGKPQGVSSSENYDDEEADEEDVRKTKLTGEVEDWFKCAQLMHRVDIVTSQVLAIAITSFQTTLALAAAGSPHHQSLLPRILDVGFLVSLESLLSAYGGELCMVEDLSVAVEWLSTVTVRVVEVKNHRFSTGARAYSSESRSQDIGGDGKKGYGFADGVWVRRGRRKGGGGGSERNSRDSSRDIAGIKWGEIVVDIEVNYETAQAVREASKILKDEVERESVRMDVCDENGTKRVWKKLTRRASSPIIGTNSKLGDFDGPASPEMSDLFSKRVRLDDSMASPCEGNNEWGAGNDVEVLACCRLTAVLFTQGINAQATLANAKMGGDASIQTSINRASMQRLKAYTANFRGSLCRTGVDRNSKSPLGVRPSPGGGGGGGGGGGEGILQQLDRLYNKAQGCVNESCINGNEKNVNVLLKTSDLCRFLNGTHGVLCKSGKDRTSMAVTLEQARYLCSSHGVVSGKKSAEIMRRHGVRRHNVWANTGQRNFAFNGINYQSLPKCFKPPAGCFSGSVMT
ncbi:hypothetical protein TrRE_jg2062 [Triparma retinervis]|uniref:PH domain-containing protein n=1 Tax=Triparma retinervis TaxID=2557542 RepID=A0A9W7E5U6_9STRA|nr:hypothetical protein TrRE_jg2062 [Triparma retinervis]